MSAAVHPIDESHDERLLRDTRCSMAMAPTPLAKLQALKGGAASLAIAIRHGSLHRADVEAALYEQAENVGLVQDLSDTVVEIAIRDGLDSPPFGDGAALAPPLPPLSIDEWLARELPAPDFLMGQWMTTTSRALLVAATGLGKTNLAIALGMAIAAGADFLHWRATRPARVLYIDGEMSRRLLKQRVADAVKRLGSAPACFYALSHEDIEGFAPLNTPAGQACIDRIIAQIGGVDLAIFDSVMCLTIGDMKDEESWQQTLPWARSLTRRSIGQIWNHHTGHDETRSYGTKTREWQLDTVVHLEAVRRDDTDVSFSLQFRKARERTPETRADFQDVRIALVNDAWEHDAVKANRPGRLSPLGLKFLDALQNAISGSNKKAQGQPAAATDEWRTECIQRGLIDPDAKPAVAKALFNKYRREIIAANRIGCEGDLSWLI